MPQHAAMLIMVALGAVACTASFMLIVPVSRELFNKLSTLVDMCRRADPERYAAVVGPCDPFVEGKFKHNRISPLLKADLSPFGELCQRLQREARRLDRRAHIRMWPVAVYVAGAALWFVLKR